MAGLAGSEHPDAPLWREQAAISDIATFGLGIMQTPAWHELSNRAPMEFDDEERRIRWVFSHDLGKFVGYGLADRQRVGELGVDGQGRLPTPPLPAPGGLLLGRHTLHQFDAESQRVLLRVRLPDDEIIAGVQYDGERLALLSHRALYFYDARPMRLGDGLLSTRQRVPLPDASGNLQRVDVMELLDGHLVSFTHTRLRHNGMGGSFQQVMRVDTAGRVDFVARRELDSGYGPLFTWQTWWLSPAISLGLDALRPAFSLPQPGHSLSPLPRPAGVTGLAIGLMLLSLLVGAWHVRRTELSRRGALGLVPGLRRGRPAGADGPVAAGAAARSCWTCRPRIPWSCRWPRHERRGARARRRLPGSPPRLAPDGCIAFAVYPAMAVDAATRAPAGDAALRAAVAAERARPVPARLPRAAFLAQARERALTLSPDGRQLAWLADAGGRQGVWMQTLPDGTAAAAAGAHRRRRAGVVTRRPLALRAGPGTAGRARGRWPGRRRRAVDARRPGPTRLRAVPIRWSAMPHC